MTLKGNYNAGTSYSVGDIVKYTDNVVYHLQRAAAAGTPCTDTLYWGRLDQTLAEAARMILDIASSTAIELANNLTTATAGKALDATQGKALKDALDALTGRVAAVEEAIADDTTPEPSDPPADSEET